MNRMYLVEMFIGFLVLISSIYFGVKGMYVGLLILVLFLPPFKYHLRILDERQLILESRTGKITGYLLLFLLAILFIYPNLSLGIYNVSEIWFPIAFGFWIFTNGIVSYYLFERN